MGSTPVLIPANRYWPSIVTFSVASSPWRLAAAGCAMMPPPLAELRAASRSFWKDSAVSISTLTLCCVTSRWPATSALVSTSFSTSSSSARSTTSRPASAPRLWPTSARRPVVASLVACESPARLFIDEMRKVVDIAFVEIKVVLIPSPHSRKKLPQHLIDGRDQLRRGGKCALNLQHERHFVIHVDAVYVRERVRAALQQCLAIGRFVVCALALGFQPTGRRPRKVDQACIRLGQRRRIERPVCGDVVDQLLEPGEIPGLATG